MSELIRSSSWFPIIETRPADPTGRSLLIDPGMSAAFGQIPARRTRNPLVPPFRAALVTSR